MPLITIKRRCDECEKTRQSLAAIQDELKTFRLDYENLYEKVRTNLSKLARRADRECGETISSPDPLSAARQALLERKLNRRVQG